MRPFKSMAFLALAMCLSPCFPVGAQDYPSKSFRVIIPYSAGSPIDAMARFLAEELAIKTGQSVVPENRPGAATMIGTRAVADASPDGYTILVQAAGIILNALVEKDAGYKFEDFTPIAPLGAISSIVAVPKTFPANNLKEFIAHVKANPGKYNFGTLGGAGPIHLLSERFLNSAGIQMVAVQYKGAADGMRDLMAGTIEMHIIGVQMAYPQIEAGSLKAIAMMNEDRHKLLPNVETFKEAGMPEMNATPWVAAFARADIPKPVLEKLRQLTTEVVLSKAYRDRLEKAGGDVWTSTGDELNAELKQDTLLWEKDIARLRLKAK